MRRVAGACLTVGLSSAGARVDAEIVTGPRDLGFAGRR